MITDPQAGADLVSTMPEGSAEGTKIVRKPFWNSRVRRVELVQTGPASGISLGAKL